MYLFFAQCLMVLYQKIFLIKLIIWDTFILRDSSTLGTPLVIPKTSIQGTLSCVNDVPLEEDTSLKRNPDCNSQEICPHNRWICCPRWRDTSLHGTLSCAKDVPLGEIQPNGDLTAGFGCRSSNRSLLTNATFSSG